MSRVFSKEGRRKSSHGSRRTAEEGRCSTFESTCKLRVKADSTHGRGVSPWFRRSFVMQARLLDICLTCLLGRCILEGRAAFEDETLIVNISWNWCCFRGKIIFRERILRSFYWGYFGIEISKKRKKEWYLILVVESNYNWNNFPDNGIVNVFLQWTVSRYKIETRSIYFR